MGLTGMQVKPQQQQQSFGLTSQDKHRIGNPHTTTRHNHTTCGSLRDPITMVARPPPSYEWTLHPGLTDYGAVCTLFGHTYAVSEKRSENRKSEQENRARKARKHHRKSTNEAQSKIQPPGDGGGRGIAKQDAGEEGGSDSRPGYSHENH